MSRFYPDKPDSKHETAWNFLLERRVRTMASVKKIEELIKKGKSR